MQLVSLLIGILIGCIISLGLMLVYFRWHTDLIDLLRNGDPMVGMRDDLLIGFLALASFALGVFLTYALLSFHL
jgi:hypothetical protein